MKLVYDGSFDGLLSAVFDTFDLKISNTFIENKDSFQPDFFEEFHTVISDKEKSRRVWTRLKAILPKDWVRKLWCCYLSENEVLRNVLFQFIVRIFKEKDNKIWENFGNDNVLDISLMAKKVEREKHRMKAFIRFEKSDDGLYYALIEPDFNVLPLIISFFKNRYADQPWLIYDVKRDYGIHYDTHEVNEVQLSIPEISNMPAATIQLDEKENIYSELWRTYYKSTNIVARKNFKLHIQHVPKRYWRYLTEKKNDLS